jgi:benzoylformate decarboxylase
VLTREVLLEVLRTEGVTHIFGNPGSTELPLIDALAGADDLRYVLALQEATAVGMADGYAQATGRPAFVNLHTAAGLGNAIGNLTNAKANGTPLVVTAGQQDERHLADDPLLSGDLVGLAAAVSKWTHEVRSPDELGTILRRAFHDAAAPPSGPVFVSIRMDHLEREVTAPIPPPSEIDTRTVAADLPRLAQLLTEPARGELAIVAGDEVAQSGAVDALVALADALGAPVWGSPLHGRAVFPPTHPQWQGMLAPSTAAIRSALAPYRRVFLVGGQAFMVYPRTEGPPLGPGTELVHLAPSPGPVARAHPVLHGAVGDPRVTLTALLREVQARLEGMWDLAVDRAAAEQRADAERAARETTARERYGPAPMAPMAAAHALLRALPAGTPVVDEAITTGVYVRGFHHGATPATYFFTRGGGLGWGMPASLGVSLARGKQPVLCVVGDGSTMYSPQALWTAAREELPVLFAVVDNGQYLILKNLLRGMAGTSVERDRFVAMDLGDPPVDFVALAASMGVDGSRVDSTDDITDVVKQALDRGRPHLLHVPITVPASNR